MTISMTYLCELQTSSPWKTKSDLHPDPSNSDPVHKNLSPAAKPISSTITGGGGGGVFLASKDFGRMFDHSFQACTFFF